jgi:2-succinyl-5-enolpyruvyl-6-hydroxy-3-cyclohexene-1-carboxylate synthase
VLDHDDLLTEPGAARDLAATIPSDTNLVVASSMPVPTAFGIALATCRPTYALAGDLSMLHDQNGLIVGNDRGVDLTFVVLNNDGGGIFSFLPQAGFPQHFETLFGTPHGINFERFAAMYDIAYERVERASELEKALAPGGVRLVEVRTERRENVEVHRRAWAEVDAALAAAVSGF